MSEIGTLWKEYCSKNAKKYENSFQTLFNYEAMQGWKLKDVSFEEYEREEVVIAQLNFEINNKFEHLEVIASADERDYSFVVQTEEVTYYNLGQLLDLTVEMENANDMQNERRYVIGHDNVDKLVDLVSEYKNFLEIFANLIWEKKKTSKK